MIGVLINKEGNLTDFFNWEKIELYKEGFFNQPITVFQNTMDNPVGLREFRENLEKTSEKLQKNYKVVEFFWEQGFQDFLTSTLIVRTLFYAKVILIPVIF